MLELDPDWLAGVVQTGAPVVDAQREDDGLREELEELLLPGLHGQPGGAGDGEVELQEGIVGSEHLPLPRVLRAAGSNTDSREQRSGHRSSHYHIEKSTSSC